MANINSLNNGDLSYLRRNDASRMAAHDIIKNSTAASLVDPMNPHFA